MQNNQPRLVVVANKNICVVRQGKGLTAFENECPHMGEGLSGGLINFMNEIVCPLHSYKFNLHNGEEESRRCPTLKFIVVEFNSEGVFLDL